MRDEKFLRYAEMMTSAIMTDKTPVMLETNVQEIFLVLSAIQLTWRHPELSQAMRDAMRQIAAPYEIALLTIHPASADLIAAGWDISADVSKTARTPHNGGLN